MRKASTSKEKEIIMKPDGMEETLQVLRYLSLFMCFLMDFFFVLILKRHERYFSKQPILLTLLYTEAENKQRRWINRVEERKDHQQGRKGKY